MRRYRAHLELFERAFLTRPEQKALDILVARTLEWTSTRPRPRLHAVARSLQTDSVFQDALKLHTLDVSLISHAQRMLPLPGADGLPGLATVRELADWLLLDPEHLEWFADLRDRNRGAGTPQLQHYTVRKLGKPNGAVRVVESPKRRLKAIQRQILSELLEHVPLHPAVHGFRKGRSIVSFVEPHAGKDAVLRMDLEEFFVSISGPRVQALFRTLGYPEPVADLLGGLCTTTTPKRWWNEVAREVDSEELHRLRTLYARPHLPQGAPTSPAIANLCAFRLDRRLAALAAAANASYTRYADDLAFSGDRAFGRSAERFAARVGAIVSEEGFAVNYRKTRLMRASVRQHLAGLTINERPNLSRRDLDALEATLMNCVRRGAASQNRDGVPDFRAHLEGRVAFAAMVNGARAEWLKELLGQIAWE